MFHRRRKSFLPPSSYDLRRSSSLNTMTLGFSALGPSQGTAPPRPLENTTGQSFPICSAQADGKLLPGSPRANPEIIGIQTPHQREIPETPKGPPIESSPFHVTASIVSPSPASPSMNRGANRFFGELELPQGDTCTSRSVKENTRTPIRARTPSRRQVDSPLASPSKFRSPNKARRVSTNTAIMAGTASGDVAGGNSARKTRTGIGREASEPATGPLLRRPPGLRGTMLAGGRERDQTLKKEVNADQRRKPEMETPALEKDGRLRRFFRITDSIDHPHLDDNLHDHPRTPSHRTEYLLRTGRFLDRRQSSIDGVLWDRARIQHEPPLRRTENLVSNPIQKSQTNSYQRTYPPDQPERNPGSRQRMKHSMTAPAYPLIDSQRQAKPLLFHEEVETAHILHGRRHGKVIDDEMIAWAERLGLAIDGTTGQRPRPQALTIQTAIKTNNQAVFHGTPPRLWDAFHNAGIWNNIFKHVSKSDLCKLARLCHYAKFVAESHLYAELSFTPRFPHSCSFFSLGQRLVACLKSSRNNAKYAAYTKSIVISAGWIQNARVTIETEHDGGRARLVKEGSKMQFKPEGDGGVRELNMGLQLLVSRCLRLESLEWLSPIPMNTFLTASKLARRATLRALHINLAQPPPTEIVEIDKSDKATSVGFQTYSPALSSLGSVPLVDLSLTELPSLTAQIHSLLKSVANTLRYLTLELADCAPSEIFTPLDVGLRLHTLRLKRIQFEPRGLEPTIENLTLQGQSNNIVLSTDMAANILQFTTDSWTCLDAAVAIARIGTKKEIAFVPHAPRLRGVKLKPLLAEYRHLQRLEFSKQCVVTCRTLEIFSLSACAVQWLTIPIEIDQWTAFLPVSVNLRCLKYIGLYVVHDGTAPFRDAAGPADNSGYLRALRPAHFAEQLVEAFDNSGASLCRVMINGFEWKVSVGGLVRSNQTPAPKLVRVKPEATKITHKGGAKLIEVSRVRSRRVFKQRRL